jgi:glutathione reductase (NADPH)
MSRKFDLVAIGSGAAASTVAMRCRKAGWKVALIDSLPLGGTCALRGCDPKKVLVGATEAIDWQARLKGKGVRAQRVEVVWPELMRFKESFTEPVPERRRESFAGAGIEIFQGRARFAGENAIEVGEEILEAHHVHIGAGAKPIELPIHGRERLVTSDRFLELEELPARLVLVGGGYISFEFAHVAARAGARVTLVHRSEPLKGFDPGLVARLVERTRALGVEVHLQTDVRAIEKGKGGFTVKASSRERGEEVSFESDLVVHGGGRVPDIDDLALEKGNVARSAAGIRVNEYLQSVSNPSVYAAGDAAATEGPPLTPVAGYEGRIAAANLLEGNHRRAEYPPVPSVVFTLPPLARVGMLEREARERGLKFRVSHDDTSSWYSSRRIGEEFSGYKVLIEEGSERILGAHLLGPHAEETINLFAMAMHAGMKPQDVKNMIFAYPTVASDVPYML